MARMRKGGNEGIYKVRKRGWISLWGQKNHAHVALVPVCLVGDETAALGAKGREGCREGEKRMEERMPAVRDNKTHTRALTLVKMVGMVTGERKTVAAEPRERTPTPRTSPSGAGQKGENEKNGWEGCNNVLAYKTERKRERERNEEKLSASR